MDTFDALADVGVNFEKKASGMSADAQFINFRPTTGMDPMQRMCNKARFGRLSSTIKRTINLRKLLRESLLPLLWHRISATITGIVSAKRIDSGVQGRKTSTASDLIITSVQGNKIIHLLTSLADSLSHTWCATSQFASGAHVGENQCCI